MRYETLPSRHGGSRFRPQRQQSCREVLVVLGTRQPRDEFNDEFWTSQELVGFNPASFLQFNQIQLVQVVSPL
jgi:hypothetical protein